jgi:hypothetical protein
MAFFGNFLTNPQDFHKSAVKFNKIFDPPLPPPGPPPKINYQLNQLFELFNILKTIIFIETYLVF